jgi:hypothetical protein
MLVPTALRRFIEIGTAVASGESRSKGGRMEPFNLSVWLPAMFLLGLVTMGLMFAFVAACDKV